MATQHMVLADIYRKRIDEVARGHAESVILVARNTSGKTYTLFVIVPGLRPLQKIVVKLHRKLHKLFWAIVKAAVAWLDAFKALFAPAPLLLPATVGSAVPVKTPQQMLASAVAAIPERATVSAASKRQRNHKGDNMKRWATSVADEYYRPDNVYTRGLHEAMRELEAEKLLL